MLTKKREDQTTCSSRVASKLHSGANKIQISLLKDSRLDLVGVTPFLLWEAKRRRALLAWRSGITDLSSLPFRKQQQM